LKEQAEPVDHFHPEGDPDHRGKGFPKTASRTTRRPWTRAQVTGSTPSCGWEERRCSRATGRSWPTGSLCA